MKQSPKVFALAIMLLLISAFLQGSAFADKDTPYPILYTNYRQMGWGDRVEIGYVDSSGCLWEVHGNDSDLQWPDGAEAQLAYLTDQEFEKTGCLSSDALSDLQSLISSVEESDASPHAAACDAGTEATYAVRCDREGNAAAILLGMSGDDCFENPDPNAQELYLAMRKLFPTVTSYFGDPLIGPAGFSPVKNH